MYWFRCAAAALTLFSLAGMPALAAVAAIPIHGVVLGDGPHGTVVVRTDPVTGIVAAQTRAFQIVPKQKLVAGIGIDAFLDRSRSPWRLYQTSISAKFEPGLPESGKVFPIDYGSQLPHTRLVDQRGALVDLAADFRGKVMLITFIFTRCPDKDECPAVSTKFTALQQRLDPKRFHLVEITLDPVYDSPWVMQKYAQQFGAHSDSWSMLTGQQHDVQHLLDRFGISSLRVSDAKFIHNDKVFIATPDGKIADIVQSVGFSPDAIAAEALHVGGLASSPFGRLKLAIVAGAVALCGGSQFAGVVLLETVAFLIIAVLSFLTLGWAARKIWKRA